MLRALGAGQIGTDNEDLLGSIISPCKQKTVGAKVPSIEISIRRKTILPPDKEPEPVPSTLSQDVSPRNSQENSKLTYEQSQRKWKHLQEQESPENVIRVIRR